MELRSDQGRLLDLSDGGVGVGVGMMAKLSSGRSTGRMMMLLMMHRGRQTDIFAFAFVLNDLTT